MGKPIKRAAHKSHPYCKPLKSSIDHHIRLRQLLDHNDLKNAIANDDTFLKDKAKRIAEMGLSVMHVRWKNLLNAELKIFAAPSGFGRNRIIMQVSSTVPKLVASKAWRSQIKTFMHLVLPQNPKVDDCAELQPLEEEQEVGQNRRYSEDN
ncbi:hypothetical protein EVAR_45586_1 [Eumeta japonica]|uniref:Uncharacterized protein n=1 Tax=Eumeta variegata TaxID=151549 RepID=A0A4C1YWM2_EUMVA|nr:hypothetical protein EVAR_45586_1 [Eumeta japonica]